MPRERESWVDAAKGIAILGVVFFHAVIVMVDVDLAWRWRGAAGLLDTFRMPLFFLTAGLFAAAVLEQPFRTLVHRRLARLVWLYVLWSALWVAAFAVLPWPRPGEPRPDPSELPLLLVWPNATTWFVYGLAVFLAVTWLARRVPTWALLGGALLLSVVAARVDTGNEPLDKMGTYYLFFVAAVRLGPRVRALAPRIRGWHALTLVPLYVGGALALTAANLLWVPGARVVISTVAVAAGVAAAVVLSRVGSAAWLVTLGRHTLPVYLLHSYPILAAAALLGPSRAVLGPWAALVPPVLTVVAVAVALLVHRGTRWVPGLYELPRWAGRALEPGGVPAGRSGRRPESPAGSVAVRPASQ